MRAHLIGVVLAATVFAFALIGFGLGILANQSGIDRVDLRSKQVCEAAQESRSGVRALALALYAPVQLTPEIVVAFPGIEPLVATSNMVHARSLQEFLSAYPPIRCP